MVTLAFQRTDSFVELKDKRVGFFIQGMAGPYAGTVRKAGREKIVVSNSDGVYHVPVEKIQYLKIVSAK